MKTILQRVRPAVLACGISCIVIPLLLAKEILTPKEIETIQEDRKSVV